MRGRGYRRAYPRRRWGYRRRHTRRHRGRYRRGRRGLKRRHFRRGVRRKFVIRATRASHYTRCKIKGWWPLFCCNADNYHKRFKITAKNKAQGTGQWDIKLGGSQVETFTLDGLYLENKGYRNIWSQTNTGRDLVMYHGCTITLYAHNYYAYIFAWDTDVKEIDPFTAMSHPAVLLNWPRHTVMLPVFATGKATKKIRIPTPAAYEKDWEYSSDMHNGRTFVWACSLFDWRDFLWNPTKSFPTPQDNEWWQHLNPSTKIPTWLSNWTGESGSQEDNIAAKGPFVIKVMPKDNSWAQAYMQYTFHFSFAGDSYQKFPLTNPNPAQAIDRPSFRPSHPAKPCKNWIGPGDLLSGGELSRDKWEDLCASTDSEFFKRQTKRLSRRPSYSRSPSPVPLKKKKETPTGSRRPKPTTPSPRRGHHRWLRNFYLFRDEFEHELGRRLTSEEEVQAWRVYRDATGLPASGK